MRWLSWLTFAGVAAVSANERPSEEAATGFITELADRAAQVLQVAERPLQHREADLRRLLREGFAIELIARIALGKHWPRVEPADRAEYVDVFGEFLLRTYGSKLAAFERDRFEVVGADPRGKQDVVVQTRILQDGGPPIRAAWRVRLIDGRPRIIDILVEGVSMALNQRQEFNSVLGRNGLSGLMEMLRARTGRLPIEGAVQAAAK